MGLFIDNKKVKIGQYCWCLHNDELGVVRKLSADAYVNFDGGNVRAVYIDIVKIIIKPTAKDL